ncbi:MAG: endolytic transglycosylase MltG [Bacteroidota bacterium]
MGKVIRIGLGIILVVALIAGYLLYSRVFLANGVPNTDGKIVVEIPTGSTFEDVVAMLKNKGIVRDAFTFEYLADYMNYKKDPMRAGRFELVPGWNGVDVIRHLRNGKQAPVRLVLSMERLTEEVAGKAASFIEADSTDLWEVFQDEAFIAELGYTPETLMSLFIPNTYEVYWNMDGRAFLKRMKKEHEAFWSKKGRAVAAKSLGLTPAEVYTLASIVERETTHQPEKPRMAGVYLNRLEQGILLQADPTSVFARRDFSTTRVTNYHTQYDSPYNTYMYAGLPPGPISMASISSIDAVLNAEDHDYIFFCSKGDGSGVHAFAKSLEQHNRNAQRYRQNLRKRGLR